jgi:sulfite oxidase
LGTPQDLGTPLGYFDQLITPTPVFFVRSHFGAPAFNRNRKISIQGGSNPLELGLKDLLSFERVTLTAVLQCSGNGRGLQTPHVPGLQWEHGAMGQATWSGVRLADLLQAAGVTADVASSHVQLQGADRPQAPTVPAFIRSIPLAKAMEANTLVATHMNGEPLTSAHGAPFRLVIPGWSGQNWIKWLSVVRVQKNEAEGFYQRTGYRLPKNPVKPGTAVKPEDTIPVTSMPVRSVIASPADGSVWKKGEREIKGVAFSGEAGIAQVEISLDDGISWSAAKLHGPSGPGIWQVFKHKVSAPAGATLKILARATDTNGQQQPRETVWNPSGYFWNAWHAVNVKVSA